MKTAVMAALLMFSGGAFASTLEQALLICQAEQKGYHIELSADRKQTRWTVTTPAGKVIHCEEKAVFWDESKALRPHYQWLSAFGVNCKPTLATSEERIFAPKLDLFYDLFSRTAKVRFLAYTAPVPCKIHKDEIKPAVPPTPSHKK